MTPSQQELLRSALERTADRFFRERGKLLLANGSAARLDATGLLVVLSHWVGDLIKGAPENMRDDLFLGFADAVVTIAGIKSDEAESEEEVEVETLQCIPLTKPVG